MSLHDEKAAALSEILAATGEPVVWKGGTYQALVTDNTKQLVERIAREVQPIAMTMA